MEKRPLADTGLELSVLSFGASSIGAEFRKIDVPEALRCVQVALDRGMNYIDTAAYYGRGMSEVMLGQVLPDIPRDSYVLSTKLGRFAPQHFDFSARRVAESVDISLERMRLDHLDIVFCHDIEFVNLDLIVEETLPALRKEVEKGKVRFIGVSGYPMKMFHEMLSRTELDAILTYNHYTLQNDAALSLVQPCQDKNVGLINAAPALMAEDARVSKKGLIALKGVEVCAADTDATDAHQNFAGGRNRFFVNSQFKRAGFFTGNSFHHRHS